MEQSVKIKTDDGHVIYGTLTRGSGASRKLIVFVHGLTGHKDQHIFYNAARFFPGRGFATFRFDLYSENPKGRKLKECTIKTHTADLNLVVRHFARNFSKLFLVGHSLGGPTILSANLSRIRGIVLWDPSYSDGKGLTFRMYCKYVKCLDAYVIRWDVESIISKAMFREIRQFPRPQDIMESIHPPTKIISAGKGALIEGGKEYYRYAREPKGFAMIPKAAHSFNEWGAADVLFQETLEWFKSFRAL
jgi:pimeloyl-ACP methyl ester carboxylesterase